MATTGFTEADLEENRQGKVSRAQAQMLREDGRNALGVAVGMTVAWAAGTALAAFVGGSRFTTLFTAGLLGVFLLGLAGLSLLRFIYCALDRRSPPAIVEGKLVKTFSTSRGRRLAEVRVGGQKVLCPSSRCDALPAVDGSCRAYYGVRSRFLLAVEPRHATTSR
jgi:hypothetical protein